MKNDFIVKFTNKHKYEELHEFIEYLDGDISLGTDELHIINDCFIDYLKMKTKELERTIYEKGLVGKELLESVFKIVDK